MGSYYCHACSTSLGIVKPDVPTKVTGTPYQLGKFIKHTAPTGTYDVNSVFADSSTQAYRGYIVTGTLAGYTEIDDRGRTNLLWFAGQQIGVTVRKGQLVTPADMVVVACHDNKWKIHGFPAPSTHYGQLNCQNCGAGLLSMTST